MCKKVIRVSGGLYVKKIKKSSSFGRTVLFTLDLQEAKYIEDRDMEDLIPYLNKHVGENKFKFESIQVQLAEQPVFKSSIVYIELKSGEVIENKDSEGFNLATVSEIKQQLQSTQTYYCCLDELTTVTIQSGDVKRIWSERKSA
ncbi:hypothetical protein SIM22_04400 [Bacillus cereus group sp. BfR-BA-01363]|uniref:hypothetical protein n=1 Tax=Bacillus cereus group sp. BfR-BA-01363 TaxID=3094882 RepID=UPI0029C2BDC5|nr:hypothetical protein [Bacillus cereus group sp. BfR-BA-01363]MDX5853370.1 hypothetical protein [Bacillus cereus group sp. BfR-BA-01363]